MEPELLTEVPTSLKRLARMVIRGFYSIEHAIIIDMLVRNPCMKEDDLVEMLSFDRKQLRSAIAQLKNDKFIKVRLKMETGSDGKATRQNYYFINYKGFINVTSYKLDHMRCKLEMKERDSTSRASFKCPKCSKTFTDLEVNLLFDPGSCEFHCTFCGTVVEEDESSLPKQNSRLLLAEFNDQIKPLYDLLRDVEDVRLAPELLEPEPTDLSDLKRDGKLKHGKQMDRAGNMWSGESTRNRDYNLDTDVTINFGDNSHSHGASQAKKERPVWMVESTVVESQPKADQIIWPGPSLSTVKVEEIAPVAPVRDHGQDDIMQVLLAHEKKGGGRISGTLISRDGSGNESDTSESDDEAMKSSSLTLGMGMGIGNVEEVAEMDDDDDDDVPMVSIGAMRVPLHEVTNDLISKMTAAEREAYISLSQEMYATMYE